MKNTRLIEQKESCAPKFDIDIQKGIEEVLRKNKVEIYKNNSINRISNNIIYLQSGDSFEVDCILCTNDKLPKLPKTKINVCNEEFILKTINDYSTEIDNLYVIGDANTNTKTPHEGKHQAWGVISKILFDNSYKLKEFPMLIQGNPEVASLGIREQDIIKKEKYKIKKHNITENLEALCENDTEGFIKLIISENTIKGAHIISKNASQLITLLSILIENKINIKRIETSSFLHLPAAKVITELLQS